ncbi:uncharacterized protein [Prorops nasuta]|uniref:uncharacterized protein isoform X2 n=1 Tax=Prorops nasuta TaxID=863751 RepID=UPI0034CF4671
MQVIHKYINGVQNIMKRQQRLVGKRRKCDCQVDSAQVCAREGYHRSAGGQLAPGFPLFRDRRDDLDDRRQRRYRSPSLDDSHYPRSAAVERCAFSVMLLYSIDSIVHTTLSVSVGAAVQIILFLLPHCNLYKAHAALPPGAEDEIILLEHLPGGRQVHLQDFFWTGIEDAPPWVEDGHGHGITYFETKTVHHMTTIYAPSKPGEDHDKPSEDPGPHVPDCISCIEPTPTLDENEENDIGVLIGDDPGPRYWLLTVLQAGEVVPPKIELRLARLYKTAFDRQQQRHLGLLSKDPRGRRLGRVQPLRFDKIAHLKNFTSNEGTLKKEPVLRDSLKRSEDEEVKREGLMKTSQLNVTMYEKLTHYHVDQANQSSHEINQRKGLNITRWPRFAEEDRNSTLGTSSKLRTDRSMRSLVQVRMQNTSVIESGATRLIYTVHLDGKPVPAETASRDMALLSSQEVALELGAPVIVQSEPLSRKRDVWLLVGAGGAAIVILVVIVSGIILIAKRKRAHSAAVAPPSRSILKKEREFRASTVTAGGQDNAAFSTSDTDKSDLTSQRPTPVTLSRTPATPDSPASLEAGLHEISSDNDEETQKIWDAKERSGRKTRTATTRMMRTNAMDQPRTPDSIDSTSEKIETLDSVETGHPRQEEGHASPHSYLSMPSCKQFPNMRSVEPLSKLLEPVMVRHLDVDSPETSRRGHAQISRASSTARDPGVVGPIVWNLRKQKQLEGASETEAEPSATAGPVGRARRRLHELLEDSFSLFGSRDPKAKELQSAATSGLHATDTLAPFPDIRGKSAHVSPVATPTTELKTRPRTSVPRQGFEDDIEETGFESPIHPKGAWGSRPLSAGPFHRPNLPEVDIRRVLVDSQLPPEDPAVQLITTIKKELEKFS